MTAHAQEIRPLRAWGLERQEVLAERVRQWVTGWCEDWGVPCEMPLQVQVRSTSQIQGISWQPVGANAMGPDAAVQWVFAALWGHHLRPGNNPSGKDLALDVARDAWADWLARGQAVWRSQLQLAAQDAQNVESPMEEFDWSGSLRFDFGFCGHPMVIRVAGDLVASFPFPGDTQDVAPRVPKAAPLVDIAHALGNTTLPVRAELASVDITLGDLQSLALEDVIVLPHPVKQPARLTGPEGHDLCDAWLGSHAGHMALELVRPASSR